MKPMPERRKKGKEMKGKLKNLYLSEEGINEKNVKAWTLCSPPPTRVPTYIQPPPKGKKGGAKKYKYKITYQARRNLISTQPPLVQAPLWKKKKKKKKNTTK